MDYKQLIEEELERTSKLHDPKFYSRHQAIAVIFEEFQETEEALEFVKRSIDALWCEHVKRRSTDTSLKNTLDDVGEVCEELVTEAIQVGAMVEKFKRMLNGKE